MTTHQIDCETFDQRLADYLDGDLATSERRAAEAHLASCVRCTALVRDLEQIRVAAGALPELTPSVDLWDGIARRIEAPVVPLAASAAPNAGARQPRFARVRMTAAAAALVVATAGITYTLTVSRGVSRTGGTTVAANTRSVPHNDSVVGAARDADTSNAPLATVDSQSVPEAPREPTPQAATVQNAGNVRRAPAPDADSREIDRLRSVFLQNRSRLDPRTAAIIEANLKVIDEAIAQSKAALALDPASRFLNNQLKSAVDKKLELLKTAAQLPSRT